MKRLTAEVAEERRVVGASSSGNTRLCGIMPEQDAPATIPPGPAASSAVNHPYPPMSNDAKAIVLLCGRLGQDSGMEPLQQSEYTRIVRWLLSKDYGLVISADHRKGGTWAGAEEELRRTPGRPVFVRITGSVPAGNRKLLELGAVSFPHNSRDADPATTLQYALKQQPANAIEEPDLPLFDAATWQRRELALVRETPEPAATEAHKTPNSTEKAAPATIDEAGENSGVEFKRDDVRPELAGLILSSKGDNHV